MSAADTVFGIKIILNDRTDIVSADADIGLYNITSLLTQTALDAQKELVVADGTLFKANQLVYIYDNVTEEEHREENVIDSIVGNVLTMKNNLQNAYIYEYAATVCADSVFGWIQNDIPALTGNWKSGMIVQGGIQPWVRSIDLKRGGNIAQSGSCSVSIKNTSQFWNSLQTKSIYLNGCRVEIYKFSGVTPSIQWSGICEKPTWNAKEYIINMCGYHNKRIANIGTQIDSVNYPDASSDLIGNSIPCTFGEIKPIESIYNGYAKFVSTANKNSEYKNISRITMNESINLVLRCGSSDQGLKAFPIVGNDEDTPPITYKIQWGTESDNYDLNNVWYLDGAPIRSGTYDITYFTDKYITVIEGTGRGRSRKIASAQVDLDTEQYHILLTLYDYFEDTLAGNATATAVNQTWIKIIEYVKKFESDVWPCKAFLDTNGSSISLGLLAYAYDSSDSVTVDGDSGTFLIDKTKIDFISIPDFAYINDNEDLNSVVIDAKQFKNSVDNIDSFYFLPITNLSLYTEGTLNAWELSSYTREKSGLFKKINDSPYKFTVSSEIISNNFNDVSDRNSLTLWQKIGNYIVRNVSWRHAIEFALPEIPSEIKDNFETFISLKLKTVWGAFGVSNSGNSKINIICKRFVGSPTDTFEKTDWNDDVAIADPETVIKTFDTTPDFYYRLNTPNWNNKWFYWNNASDGTSFGGYTNIQLSSITNKDIYNSIRSCLLSIYRIQGATQVTIEDWIQLYEMMVILKRSLNVKNDIYFPVQGRIFDDTWQSRKTAINLIESPIDIMEHVERLSCWSDFAVAPGAGWGKAYAVGAKIDTTSFDDTTNADYAILHTYKVSNQLQKFDECYTDKIQRSICKDFFLAKWYDKDGSANIIRIKKSSSSPADAITLSDIVNRNSIEIIEPSPEDIFPEPFVRYRKNFANGNYEGIIRIKNTSAMAYQSGYIEGISDASEAEQLWNKCHDLWLKAGHLEKPPSDLTDKQWMNTDTADVMAKDYISNWIDWMFNPSCRISVHFNKAGDWEECHRFTLQLPHQTNNTAIECIVTKIEVDPNYPYFVTITAIMMRETIPEDLNIKDTWINFGNDNDWKDTYVNQGDDNDIKDM